MCDWILDLDFDFCVQPTIRYGRSVCRDEAEAGRLWITADELVAWLRTRGLLQPATFAGWVRQHEQVLPIWRRLIRVGRLKTPFAILHFDGHPDMMDLDPEIETRLETDWARGEEFFDLAKSGDFLQYAVRCRWVERIWMVFPDHREDEVEALAGATPRAAMGIVKKPVKSLKTGPFGGVEITVLIGQQELEVGLFSRRTLPPVRTPVATVVAHSPEFVPKSTDWAFQRLVAHLRGGDRSSGR